MTCICQQKNIKFIKYFYNVKTKLTIIIGSECCKKFDSGVDKIKNKILENILKNNILKGEYQVIDNIIEYTNSVEKQLIEYFEKYTLSKNISVLKKNTEDIKTLIDDYKLNYLNDIYNILTNLIEKEEEKLKVYSIDKCKFSSIKTFNEPIKTNGRKQTGFEERINKDGKTYWYNRDTYKSVYKNPHI